MRETATDQIIFDGLIPFLEQKLSRVLDEAERVKLITATRELKKRAKNLHDLAESAKFLFISRPLEIAPKALKSLNEDGKNTLSKIYKDLKILNEWNEENLQSVIETFIEREEIGFGKVAQPMRSALTGNNVSPGISEVLEWLGKTESLGRINDQI